MNRSMHQGNPGYVTVLIFFQDFPFSLATICNLSFISKLNVGSILKGEVASPKSDVILIAITKRINTNSNEAIWANQWEAVYVVI